MTGAALSNRGIDVDQATLSMAAILLAATIWIAWLDYTEPRIDESSVAYFVLVILAAGLLLGALLFREQCRAVWRRFRRIDPTVIVANIALAIAVISLLDAVSCRRLAFCTIILPSSLSILIRLFSTLKRSGCRSARITVGFLMLGWLAVALPGFYLPPFYDGIAGWTAAPDIDAPVRLSGLKLLRDDGETVWFSHALTNPVNFSWRQQSHARQRGQAHYQELLAYYWEIYRRRYPALAAGILPNQTVLGPYAYPGHNPYRAMPYDDFPPDRVVELVRVSETYARGTDRLIARRVLSSFDIGTGRLNRGSTRLSDISP